MSRARTDALELRLHFRQRPVTDLAKVVDTGLEIRRAFQSAAEGQTKTHRRQSAFQPSEGLFQPSGCRGEPFDRMLGPIGG